MTYGEVKDVVREHYGRIGWPSAMLVHALEGARRDIEKYQNFYWMRDSATFNTVASTQSYIIGSGSAVNEANFKDIRALHVKESGDTIWTEVTVGDLTQEEAALIYPTDEEQMPLTAILDNSTLYLYPIPDAVYNMKLWFWQWTSNPTANTSSDELTSRFPEALIYGALIWGAEQFDQNYQEADRWRALFAQELTKIHRHSLERERQDRVSLIPMTGPYSRRSKSQLVRQVWA